MRWTAWTGDESGHYHEGKAVKSFLAEEVVEVGLSTRMKVVIVFSFVLMVAVNGLANVFYFNGMNTGQVSDLYENLFTPAGYTFAIWSLIYLLLLLHVLYAAGLFRSPESVLDTETAQSIERAFIVSSLANAAWIFAWHYLITPLSMFLIVVMLVCLGKINGYLWGMRLNTRDKLLVRLPFSVYFGWITVATIANACAMLVSFGFTGAPYADIWTVVVLFGGLAIASVVTVKNADVAYALTVAWAYIGILVKHLSPMGYGGRYVDVVGTLLVCIVVLAAVVIAVCMKKRRNKEVR